MRNIDDRLQHVEEQIAQRRQRNNPRKRLRVSLQSALMDATVPDGPDGSPERQRQLDRVGRLERAYDTGDTSELLPNDLTLSPT